MRVEPGCGDCQLEPGRRGKSGDLTSALGLCAMLILLPIVVRLPIGLFEGKLTLLEPVTALTLAAWLVAWIRGRVRPDLSLRVYIPLLLFLAVGFVSVFVARSASAALVELATYANGALIFFLVHQIVTGSERGRTLGFTGLITGMVVVLVTCSVGTAGIMRCAPIPALVSRAGKLTATFMTSSQLPSYLVVILPLALCGAMASSSRSRRLASGLGAAAAAFGLCASGSRSGVIAAVIAVFAYVLWRSRRRLRALVLLSTFAIAIFSFAYVTENAHCMGPLSRSLSTFNPSAAPVSADPASEGTASVRFLFLQAWAEIARTRPLLGVGAGNFKLAYTEIIPEATRGFELHNTLLSIWAETGVLGLLSFAAFLVPFGWIGLRSLIRRPITRIEEYRAAIAFGILGSLMHQMFHMGLRQPIFWVGLGFLLALDQIARQKGTGPLVSHPREAM